MIVELENIVIPSGTMVKSQALVDAKRQALHSVFVARGQVQPDVLLAMPIVIGLHDVLLAMPILIGLLFWI